MKKTNNPQNLLLDEEDIKIENGTLDPPEEARFYPKGLLNILDMFFRNKKYERPRGKKSPTFTIDEIKIIADFIFFKPPNINIKAYKRIPKSRELPLKRKMFINHFFGDAKFNGAKAARMAGYSLRSAKQIAYKIKQT